MWPESDQQLLDEWSQDPMVSNLDNNYNDRLCRAIILHGRREIARGHGFDTHEQYLKDLDERFAKYDVARRTSIKP